MVKWKDYVESGSIEDVFRYVSEEKPYDNALDATVKLIPDQEYLKRIREICRLAARFDPTQELLDQCITIRAAYVTSGILTKKEMEFLNRVYKLLKFEEKYHSDNETTIGRINNLLGGLNE